MPELARHIKARTAGREIWNSPEKIGYVLQAWEMAKFRYVPQAIINHAGQELYKAVKAMLPGLLYAVGGLVTSTIIGALVGSLGGGVGAGLGAAAGFSIGLLILQWLGRPFWPITWLRTPWLPAGILLPAPKSPGNPREATR